jgi:hypothetical protein
MTREFCSYCGTVTNEGERICQTRAEMAKCSWMGTARHSTVMPTSEIPEPVSEETKD